MNIIIFMLLVPLAALLIELITDKRYSVPIAIGSTILMMLFSLYLLGYSIANNSIAISATYLLIPHINSGFSFYIGIVQLALLLMASVVLLVSSMSGNLEGKDPRLSSSLILLFQLASTGLFTSSNFFAFFVFWDIGVVAAFLMIAALGMASSRQPAMNFLIYEIFASAMLLIGILLIYSYTPLHTFDIYSIATSSASIPVNIQLLIFALMSLAFIVNMPLFPFHSWMPGAYSESSTQGSMVLSGILSKFGAYGLFIVFATMPIASHYAIYIAALAIISSLYGAFVMLAQTDIKRIIAYGAMAETGIVALGISASAASIIAKGGAVYGMLAQGIAIAFMFLVAGTISYEFAERNIKLIKGIIATSKGTAYAFIMSIFAFAGMPLTAGFIADILIFIGAFHAFSFYALIPLIALALAAAYLYSVASRSVLSAREHSESVKFYALPQKVGYAIFILFIFLFGVIPFAILGLL